jgi:succinoglycan biosynthesis transport protein ExoP
MSPLQILSILWRRSWILILTFAAAMVGSVGVMLTVPPRYDAVATASIDPGQLDPVTGQQAGGGFLRLLQGNLVNLAQSHRVAEMVVKRLNLVANPALVASFRASDALGRMDVTAWIADDLLSRLNASFPEGTNTLTIKYKSNNAIQAAQVANAFLAAFIDAAVEMKIASAQQTAQWFEPQTEKLRAELAAARAKLAKFQRDSQLLATTSTTDADSGPLLAVSSELSNAKSQLLKLEIYLQTANPDDSSAELQGPLATVITTLKSQLNAMNAEIGKLRTEVGANNPRLAGLVAARKSVDAQLQTEIKNNRAQMGDRLKTLKEQIDSLEKTRGVELRKMIDLQAQRDQLASLKSEVTFRQEQLERISKSADSSRMQGQLSLSNISPLDMATPPVTPAFPKTMLVVLAGIGAGLSLGVIFALLAEAFDRRVRVVSDLEFAGQTLVLGTLQQGTLRRRRLFGSGRKRLQRLPAKPKPASLPAKTRA